MSAEKAYFLDRQLTPYGEFARGRGFRCRIRLLGQHVDHDTVIPEMGGRVADEIAATIERYVLSGTDEDLKRLLKISDLVAEFARTAIQRAGVRPGWSAIECGCGPLGALPVLAQAVGPSGRVVGIDFSEAA